MTAPARKAAPAPIAAKPTGAEQLAALIAELNADQDAEIAELRAEIAELRAMLAKPEPPSWAPSGYELLATVAGRLGYSPETLRLWCCSGVIEPTRREGQWYASVESAEAYARTR
jgi:hypothetical protein